MAGTFDGVEPVLRVEVVKAVGTPGTPEAFGIKLEDAPLPVLYRSRSEALRIADRLHSLLADGFELRWEFTLGTEIADG